ncbi:MAG: protein kinase [Anaerolineae bacterium]|jgi:serine/threonine-protein kinase|nr:protein kinase [Anaerolineae bacterium]
MESATKILNNRYQLLSQQGSGGMSVIYRALDLALGRHVAVKVLRASLTDDPTFLARFRQEARNVANLQHPNIVTVHDVGQDGNIHYIVMELIEGHDLKKIIRAEAPFSLDRALDIAIKISTGIGYAHRAGLVHADVKPQNILLVDQDNIKVTDFGIAQALAATNPGERLKVVWGSPHYFSPEQAQGRYPTPASDVYSIGIVLFEMLTGRLPFMGGDQQELALAHIKEPPPHLMDFNPQLPEALDKIIQKVLAKEPSARYRMADQLGRILESYRDQGMNKTDNKSAAVKLPEAIATHRVVPEQEARFAPPQAGGTPPPTQPHGYYTQPSIPPQSTQGTRPEFLRDTGYYTPVDPPQLDMVTIALGFIAFLAIIGLIILWVIVFQVYYG